MGISIETARNPSSLIVIPEITEGGYYPENMIYLETNEPCADWSTMLSTIPLSVAYNDDGTRMYVVVNDASAIIYQYNMATPYDWTNATLAGSFAPTARLVQIVLANSEQQLFGVTTTDDFHSYTFGTVGDITTLTKDTGEYASVEVEPKPIFVTPDGSNVIFCEGNPASSPRLYELPLSTPFDLGSAGAPNSGRSLTDYEINDWSWKPDGSEVTMSLRDSVGDVDADQTIARLTFDPAYTGAKQFFEKTTPYPINAAGQTIPYNIHYYEDGKKLSVMDANGRAHVYLTKVIL